MVVSVGLTHPAPIVTGKVVSMLYIRCRRKVKWPKCPSESLCRVTQRQRLSASAPDIATLASGSHDETIGLWGYQNRRVS